MLRAVNAAAHGPVTVGMRRAPPPARSASWICAIQRGGSTTCSESSSSGSSTRAPLILYSDSLNRVSRNTPTRRGRA